MRDLFTSFARNTVFANIVLLFIFCGGLLAISQLSRETFPDIELDIIRVSMVWPGADPEEVEEGISRRIEEAIDGLEGIREFHTVSGEHVALALMEVEEGYDIRRIKEDVRNAIDTITTFPGTAESPIVQEFIIRHRVMMLSLTSPDMSDIELRKYAEDLKDEIHALPEVSHVSVESSRSYEISIQISEENLRKYGITFDQVAQLVRANSLNVPGGVMRTEGEEIRLRTVGRSYTGEDFSHIVVLARPEGQQITLGDIATINDGFAEETSIARFNGQKTVNIRVLKTKEQDTITIDRAVLKWLDEKQSHLPEGVTITAWGRGTPRLESRIFLLMRNGLVGLTLVFVLLWLFLDIRLSFWAGMGMPVSIMGAFMVMWFYGATINMMTLFGMITVLGIIVDDAIVVGEAIYYARKQGAPPLEAAVEGILEIGMPVIAAVTTTIVAFVPLFFVAGTLGRLVVPLPLVVVAALSVSLVECLFMLPAHLSHLPDPNARTVGKNIIQRLGLLFHKTMNLGLERFINDYYTPIVEKAIRWRYVSLAIAITILLITQGIMDSGIIKFDNFPKMDGDNISAVIEFPSGTPLSITEEAVVKMEKALYEVAAETKTKSGAPLVKNIYSVVGSKFDDRGGMDTGSNFGSIRVDLLDMQERDVHVDIIMPAWEKKIGMITGAVALTITGGDDGPGSQPLEIWLQGHDLDRLIAASEELKEHLATFAGVYQIQDDYRVGPNEIKIRLKPEARALGLHEAELARQIFAGYYGEEIVRIQRGADDVRVRIRYPEDERKQLSFLENIRIRPSMPAGMSAMSLAAMTGGRGGASRASGARPGGSAGSSVLKGGIGGAGMAGAAGMSANMGSISGVAGMGELIMPNNNSNMGGRSGMGGGLSGGSGLGNMGSMGGMSGGGSMNLGGMAAGGLSGLSGGGMDGMAGLSDGSDLMSSLGGGMQGLSGASGISGMGGLMGGGKGGMSGGVSSAGSSGMAALSLSGGMSRTPELPLLSVADLEYTSGATAIRRTNGQRRLVVSADVNIEVANAREIIDHINAAYFPALQAKYRDINMAFKGDHQAFRDAIDSLYISFPLAVIGIFIIVATIFRSYLQPLVILVTVPFGISGAVFGHLMLGWDLTMMSVFGLVALAGVVVNDAIVLIECINNYVANGEPFYEAVRLGGARRFRAIFLTTITTVGGLAPIIVEQGRAARPLIPMAISLASGIIFATLLTLLLIPALMCILNDMRRFFHFFTTGIFPAPEDVEPARLRKLNPDV